MAKVLGIDLGTTNSCMAVMEGGEPLVLENSELTARTCADDQVLPAIVVEIGPNEGRSQLTESPGQQGLTQEIVKEEFLMDVVEL